MTNKEVDLTVDLELLLDTGEKRMVRGIKAHAKQLINGEMLTLDTYVVPETMMVIGATAWLDGVSIASWSIIFGYAKMRKDDTLIFTFTLKVEPEEAYVSK